MRMERGEEDTEEGAMRRWRDISADSWGGRGKAGKEMTTDESAWREGRKTAVLGEIKAAEKGSLPQNTEKKTVYMVRKREEKL